MVYCFHGRGSSDILTQALITPPLQVSWLLHLLHRLIGLPIIPCLFQSVFLCFLFSPPPFLVFLPHLPSAVPPYLLYTVLGALYMPSKHYLSADPAPVHSFLPWLLSLMVSSDTTQSHDCWSCFCAVTFIHKPELSDLLTHAVSYLRGISNRTHSKFFFSFPPCMGQWWLFPSKCKPNPCCLLKFLLFVAFQT